jgi:hypothetical protein
VEDNKDYVPRSVTLADFFVVVSGFFVNIVRAVEMLASELLDLAVYNANRTTKVSRMYVQHLLVRWVWLQVKWNQ